ncbi:heavy metal-associated isoprenylated plant protein 47-like [Eucalyptus grandis]|uniref:heavy metal-associated isoprenylated plant protein 47-like n=1 Tax=Eucalyptus grandis TaxID=71139 RepID=UPI00192EE673|nr:heavy metal-associated isoprenylated plant protein 47-like [Eucalyptus grandis]
MTKRKIVIKLGVQGQRYKTRALQIATTADGVESVSFLEEREEEMVVIGKGVDAVTIVSKLRKKVGKSTKLLSVEDLVD